MNNITQDMDKLEVNTPYEVHNSLTKQDIEQVLVQLSSSLGSLDMVANEKVPKVMNGDFGQYPTIDVDILNDDDRKSVEEAAEKASTQLRHVYIFIEGYGEEVEKINQAKAVERQKNIDTIFRAIFDAELIIPLVRHLRLYSARGRKAVEHVFTCMLHREVRRLAPYCKENKEVLYLLVKGFDLGKDVAMCSGCILREMARHKDLVKILLKTPAIFEPWFEYLEDSSFAISSEAFTTLTRLLTREATFVGKHLTKNFDKFFELYNPLLESAQYITQRQALKLLGELLIVRNNVKVLMRYVSLPDNLESIFYNMVYSTTDAVKIEAFHVYKLFVGNPMKTRPIIQGLLDQRDEVIDFLEKFAPKKGAPEQFEQEKIVTISSLKELNEEMLEGAPEVFEITVKKSKKKKEEDEQ